MTTEDTAETAAADRAAAFLALHRKGDPLLLPNPWDVGSAMVLTALGFRALATTSSGFAATLGHDDGSVARAVVLEHSRTIAAATRLPVSADLENGYGDEPDVVAQTVRLATETGLAGCSIEDSTGRSQQPVYDAGLAAERVAAAVEAAHSGPTRLILTARAENHLHGRNDLADTIARLHAFQEAGADVLYAPGLSDLADVRSLVASVDRPVNVLARPGLGSVAALAEAGVARISVGGSFAFAALGALVDAGRELLEAGTFDFLAGAAAGGSAFRSALEATATPPPTT